MTAPPPSAAPDDGPTAAGPGRAARLAGTGMLAAMAALVAGFYVLVGAILVGYALAARWVVAEGLADDPGRSARILVGLAVVGVLILRGLVRRSAAPFGIPKSRAELPALFALLDEVAARVDTAPVDEVWLTPDAGIGVTETGGRLGLPMGTKRVLCLGLGTLHVLSLDEMRAVLAHEYAHFSNRDTAVARHVAGALDRIGHLTDELRRRGGWLWRLDPVRWTLRGYGALLTVAASAFSRQREHLADERAARAYGGRVFADALRKHALEATLFEATMPQAAWELVGEGKRFGNLFLAFREWRHNALEPEDEAELGARLLEARGGRLDSHPSLAARFARIGRVNPGPVAADVPADVVFPDTAGLEEELSELYAAMLLALYEATRAPERRGGKVTQRAEAILRDARDGRAYQRLPETGAL